MDFAKLDQNEKLAIYGSVVVLLAGLISNWGGALYLSILAAIVMVAVVLVPQLSPGTALPGSKGTLMATLGFIAAAGAVITAVTWLDVIGNLLGRLNTIMFLVALAGALVMAWAGWQQLQREGGRWQFGASRPAGASASAPASDFDAEEDRPRDA